MRKSPREVGLRSLFSKRKSVARQLSIPFQLAYEQVTWPDTCPILGIRLDYSYGDKGHGPCQNSPSIDRIDPRRGYTPDNIQVISSRANTLKGNGEAWEHAQVLRSVALSEGRDNQWLRDVLGLN